MLTLVSRPIRFGMDKNPDEMVLLFAACNRCFLLCHEPVPEKGSPWPRVEPEVDVDEEDHEAFRLKGPWNVCTITSPPPWYPHVP